MYGRYGTDELNLVLMILGIIVMFLSRIFWFWPLAIISYALYIYALFRMFSRNIPARQKEYYSFLKVWTPVQKWFRIKKTAFRERKQYKYFRCPGCRQQFTNSCIRRFIASAWDGSNRPFFSSPSRSPVRRQRSGLK